ncbi:MAG: ThiF family adenylyltransferase [Candidatus Thermoplasmatota archaeon]|nr:ThiF family adenylyltransferase [Candidatus Thermoplasmatota archaeon]
MAGLLRVGGEDQDRFDRSRRIGWLDLDRISDARVLVVGAGAIGNEVAKNLVLSGFQKITIVDMDHVVGSNLNRCIFFTKADASSRALKAEVVARGISSLADSVDATAVVRRIEELPPSVFAKHDVILGCLDNIAARVHVNAHSYAAGRVFVDGAMEGFLGKVTVVRPPDGACLQCGMNKTHAKVASLRFSCTGKGVVFHEPRLAAEITTTSVVAAVMVREALKVVSGRHGLLLSNLFYYDGQNRLFEEMEIPLDPSCPVHARLADRLQVSESDLSQWNVQ